MESSAVLPNMHRTLPGQPVCESSRPWARCVPTELTVPGPWLRLGQSSGMGQGNWFLALLHPWTPNCPFQAQPSPQPTLLVSQGPLSREFRWRIPQELPPLFPRVKFLLKQRPSLAPGLFGGWRGHPVTFPEPRFGLLRNSRFHWIPPAQPDLPGTRGGVSRSGLLCPRPRSSFLLLPVPRIHLHPPDPSPSPGAGSESGFVLPSSGASSGTAVVPTL